MFAILWFFATVLLLTSIHGFLNIFFSFVSLFFPFLHLFVSEFISSIHPRPPNMTSSHLQLLRTLEVWGLGGSTFLTSSPRNSDTNKVGDLHFGV